MTEKTAILPEEPKQAAVLQGNINKNVALFVFFIISMGLIFLLVSGREPIGTAVAGIPFLNLILPLNSFDSPMFYALAVVGFFFTYLVVGWVNSYFETRFASSPLFLLILIVLSLLALYVSLYWLYSEVASFTGQPVSFDFWSELRQSAFYFFLIASILGWGVHILIERL